MNISSIPSDWRSLLDDAISSDSFASLTAFVNAERASGEVFPPDDDVFTALKLTALDKVRVLILGQDPYHDDGQAHGLAFSVPPGITPPPSLRNIFRELHDDIGCPKPPDGYLRPWALQGVLLLNAVLTVRAHEPNSHKGKGWERFTDTIIAKLSERERPMVFVLWGSYARKKLELIDTGRHTVIESAHPSPLSAKRGFFGSRPFSRINEALEAEGGEGIAWCLRGEGASHA